jgi:glycerate 2-kinase
MAQQLRVVIAPSGFKESLSAEQVATAIAQGVRAACPTAESIALPLVDGGEGFTKTLATVTGGTLHPVTVTGPVGQPVEAAVGILGDPGPRSADLRAAAGEQYRHWRPGRYNALPQSKIYREVMRCAASSARARRLNALRCTLPKNNFKHEMSHY